MKTKTFILKSLEILDHAICYLHTLPYDGTLEVVVKPHTKKRSLDQNALYWELISQIAEQAFVEGVQYSPDCWHEYCKKNIMPVSVTLKDGTLNGKWVRLPYLHRTAGDQAQYVPVSTTELSKESFSEYITAVEAFAVTELGVRFDAKPY